MLLKNNKVLVLTVAVLGCLLYFGLYSSVQVYQTGKRQNFIWSGISAAWAALPNLPFTSNQTSKVASKSKHLSKSRLFPINDEDPDYRIIPALKVMAEYSKTRLNKNVTTKVVYIIGESGGYMDGTGLFDSFNCPVKECYLTRDAGRYRTADAVMTSHWAAHQMSGYLPKPAHQVWAARHMESPAGPGNDASFLRGLINWTISYRRSSTLATPYDIHFLPKAEVDPKFYRPEPKPFKREPVPPSTKYSSINYASGKTKQVAWFASNCGSSVYSGRFQYAMELAKYINVDIYGGCNNHKLRCSQKYGDNEGKYCRQMLSDDYKFYLSFENSNCRDYITEKTGFQALSSDVIPIVLGARPEDYEALMPRGSYIHVDDFKSPRHLAEYLLMLDKNDTLYNWYFRWKDVYTPVVDSYWCRFCFLLHYREEVSYTNVFPDFGEWWIDRSYCNPPHVEENGTKMAWRTWRPTGFWDKLHGKTNVHRPPWAL